MVRVITRQSFFGKYRNYILGATPVAVLLLGVAVTYSLLGQQTDIRTRATISQEDQNKIYTDVLMPGWTDKSTNATNTFNLSFPVFSGASSISFVNNKAFVPFYISREAPLTLPYWARLEFALQLGSPSGSYSVSIVNKEGNQIGGKILLSNMGGDPQVGVWKTYSVPLSSFGVIDQPISGVIIRDESGVAGNTLYIDELKFEVPQNLENP